MADPRILKGLALAAALMPAPTMFEPSFHRPRRKPTPFDILRAKEKQKRKRKQQLQKAARKRNRS